MATPKEKFAEALLTLKKFQEEGSVGIHTDEIPSRFQRDILLNNGFIKEVSRGWYISSNPHEAPGERHLYEDTKFQSRRNYIWMIKVIVMAIAIL